MNFLKPWEVLSIIEGVIYSFDEQLDKSKRNLVILDDLMSVRDPGQSKHVLTKVEKVEPLISIRIISSYSGPKFSFILPDKCSPRNRNIYIYILIFIETGTSTPYG